MNKEVPGPACVSSTRRAAANYLRGADGQVIGARARRSAGGGCDCGRGALRSVVLLQQQAGDGAAGAALRRTTAAAVATAFMVGDGCGRRRASAEMVVGAERRRPPTRAAVACPWPHGCQRCAARQGIHRIVGVMLE